MAKHRETDHVPAAEAVDYLRKDVEFQESAVAALAAGKRNSAGVLAIHAAITAADALTIHYLGLRSAGRRHLDVLGLITQTGHPRRDKIGRQLAELLGEKKGVEYEGRMISTGDSERMVKLSARVVEGAREVVR